jgi:hypothetical protein
MAINFSNQEDVVKKVYFRKRVLFCRRCGHEMVTLAKTLIELWR